MKTYPSLNFWRRVLLGVTLILILAKLSSAQFGEAQGKPNSAAPAMEFTHQEVQAETVVQTLNDLSKQGWEIFQIVPTWTVGNQNGGTELTPKTYQVFGRKPLAEAK